MNIEMTELKPRPKSEGYTSPLLDNMEQQQQFGSLFRSYSDAPVQNESFYYFLENCKVCFTSCAARARYVASFVAGTCASGFSDLCLCCQCTKHLAMDCICGLCQRLPSRQRSIDCGRRFLQSVGQYGQQAIRKIGGPLFEYVFGPVIVSVQAPVENLTLVQPLKKVDQQLLTVQTSKLAQKQKDVPAFSVNNNGIIQVGLQGRMGNVVANQIAAQCGQVTRELIQNSNTATGGHDDIRNAVNILTAKSMNEIVRMTINLMNDGYHVNIHSLGAKYLKQSRLFLRAFQNQHNRWTYVPQRNTINQYDNAYHQKSLKEYKQRRLQSDRNRFCLAPVLHRYMDEHWGVFPSTVHRPVITFVLSIDCLVYYVSKDIVKSLQTVVDRWFIVGNNYIPYPGTYPHIQRNGTYQIFVDKQGVAMVANSPRGTQLGYKHPLVHYLNAGTQLKLAYSNMIYDTTTKPSEHFHIPSIPTIRQPHVSPVSNHVQLAHLLPGAQKIDTDNHNQLLSGYLWYPCFTQEYHPFLPNAVYTDLQSISVNPNLIQVVSNRRCCAITCFCCMLYNCTLAGCCGTRFSKKPRSILTKIKDCLLCISAVDVSEDVQLSVDIKRSYR